MTVAAESGRRKRAASARAQDASVARRVPAAAARGRSPRLVRPPSARAAVARATPGEVPDPYRVWLSEIMLQQTTVKAVAPYFVRFLARWPDVQALAAAPLDDVLQALGRARLLRARAQSACLRQGGGRASRRRRSPARGGARRVARHRPYTAAAIAAIAFGVRAAAVDGNVERVVARLFAVEEELPAAKPQIRELAADWSRARGRRFRPGHDGSGRHHLHAQAAGLRALSVDARPARRAARRSGELSASRRANARAGCGAARPSWRCAPTAACSCARVRPRGLLGGMTEVPTTRVDARFRWRDWRLMRRRSLLLCHTLQNQNGAAFRASSPMSSRTSRWS